MERNCGKRTSRGKKKNVIGARAPNPTPGKNKSPPWLAYVAKHAANVPGRANTDLWFCVPLLLTAMEFAGRAAAYRFHRPTDGLVLGIRAAIMGVNSVDRSLQLSQQLAPARISRGYTVATERLIGQGVNGQHYSRSLGYATDGKG